MDTNEPEVVDRILSHQLDFSTREREISQFMLNSIDFVVSNTLMDLAHKLHVSASSVNRFCKKIGYKGFTDFKLDVVRSMAVDSLKNEERVDVRLTYAGKVAAAYHGALERTANNISETALERTAEALEESSHVYIVGRPESRASVFDFNRSLSSLGINSTLYTNQSDFALVRDFITRDDLVIVVAANFMQEQLYEDVVTLSSVGTRLIGISARDTNDADEVWYAKFLVSPYYFVSTSIVMSDTVLFSYVCDVIIDRLVNNNPKYKQILIKHESRANETELLRNSHY